MGEFRATDVQIAEATYNQGELPRAGFAQSRIFKNASGEVNNVEIYFYPPKYTGSSNQWPKVTIGIRYLRRGAVNEPFGIAPYFYHIVNNVSAGEPQKYISTLFLCVDREVNVVLPTNNTRGAERNEFLVNCRDLDANGTFENVFLKIVIKRFQLPAQVPQSAKDFANFFTQSIIYEYREDRAVIDRITALTGDVTHHGFEKKIIVQEDGRSCTISLYKINFPISFLSNEPYAVIVLEYWNIQFRGGYYLDIGESEPRRPRLFIYTSRRNIKTTLYINKFLAQTALSVDPRLSETTLRGLILFSLKAEFDIRLFFDLELIQLARTGQSNRFTSSAAPLQTYLDRFDRIIAYEDQEREMVNSFLLLVVGFTPLGPLIDICEIIVAIFFGRDIQGYQIQHWYEYLFIGLLILPFVGDVVSRMRRQITRLFDSSQLERVIRHAMLERGIDAESIFRALEADPGTARALSRINDLLSHRIGRPLDDPEDIIRLGQLKTYELLFLIRRRT